MGSRGYPPRAQLFENCHRQGAKSGKCAQEGKTLLGTSLSSARLADGYTRGKKSA